MSIENIKDKFLKGEIKAYELEDIIFRDVHKCKKEDWGNACKDASVLRIDFLEQKLGKKFNHIRKHYDDFCSIDKKTTAIEQIIGGAVVPLGFGGPLKIKGNHAIGEFYIPLANCEAALIAGFNRGCNVINESGGVRSIVTKDSMTRSVIIETPSIDDAFKLCEEVNKKGELYDEMKKAAEREGKVSKLVDIQTFQILNEIQLRYVFQTGDSMGMNSATKYAANAVKVLLEKYPEMKLKALSGNMCADKKSTHINVIFGRGKSVQTEVIIPLEVLKKNYQLMNENGEIIKEIEPRDIERINYSKNYQGSALAGTLTGFNANVANTIAAIFAATGQDLAQIVESSSAFDKAEVLKNGSLRFGVFLPCVEIGTVGGGTSYATAKECLDMLGCYGAGKKPGENAKKFAEIIGAAVTAQEINLLGTLACGDELASSHIRLARGK
ncbi:MAG: hydroxymethylglutaryl-CoA reductase [Candidatus Parvarchaeota archaeon]|nr:hydroxymethylglutaryl-CoA reductase [Candidatus Jingweiarchaeum tengchongense]MCW1298057.1 hydroxymethylglutaryl-CoA reductase [Candidatus Jingweiarchaeum tengchongense]MCW1300143.1 hydroxymethylglutaryl-CoA reductase [Candidatus Jingweiarchaeum tengchongense]MCW1309915.1 hydroxymethylglutaryl-CoA reductase [Candidatus Jingweiarchaeum tengchongense]MCW1310905.1 hydroxymethylglutaryl-CoA reductase [Candidatus Jingweiarchaeum tengchongense]